MGILLLLVTEGLEVRFDAEKHDSWWIVCEILLQDRIVKLMCHCGGTEGFLAGKRTRCSCVERPEVDASRSGPDDRSLWYFFWPTKLGMSLVTKAPLL